MLLRNTVKTLSSQGFFLTAFKKNFKDKKTGELVTNVPIFRRDGRHNLPTASEVRNRCLSPDEWEAVFNSTLWENADRIAIMCGGNGVVGFDFDAKKFFPDPEADEIEKLNLAEKGREAARVWQEFKDYLTELKVHFYLESTKNNGEHIILLVKDDVRIAFGREDITGNILGCKFLEVFGTTKSGKPSQSLTIAPSDGYTKMSEFNIWELPRLTALDFSEVMKFFDLFKVLDFAPPKEEAQLPSIVLDVYENEKETYLKVVCDDKVERIFPLSAFCGKALDMTGMKFFPHEFMTKRGANFNPLKLKIHEEKRKIPKKNLMTHADWVDGVFKFENSDDCYFSNAWTECSLEVSEQTFLEWKTSVFDVCIHYRATALAMVMAFAAPLAKILHQNFAMHLCGTTDIGKTMALRVAKAMYGDPEDLMSWEGTKTSIEFKKQQAASKIMCIDEMSIAGNVNLSSIMQMCGVTRRHRCSWYDGNLSLAEENGNISTLILSTSEYSVQDIAKSAKFVLSKGTLNRFVEFKVDRSDFPDFGEIAFFFGTLKKYAGVPMLYWARHFAKNAESYGRKFELFKQFCDCESDSSGFGRVKSHFTFLFFVAEELKKLGLEGFAPHLHEILNTRLPDLKEDLGEENILEKTEVSEFLHQCLLSSDYIAENLNATRISKNCVFFIQKVNFDNEIIYCLKPKLFKILTDNFPYGKRKIAKILKEIGFFMENFKTMIKIRPLGFSATVHKVSKDFLDNSNSECD